MIKFRTVSLFAFVILLSIFISGCSTIHQIKNATKSQQSSSSSEDSASSSSVESSTESETPSSSATLLSQSPSSQAAESFDGDWTISKFLASGSGGSTYDSETINKLIGKTLTFSKEKATCFGDDINDMNNAIPNPIYKSETLSDDEMYQNYRVTFQSLGISTNSVTQISASDNANGCTFFVIDNDTLILTGGGDFFQLKRSN